MSTETTGLVWTQHTVPGGELVRRSASAAMGTENFKIFVADADCDFAFVMRGFWREDRDALLEGAE